MKQDRTGSISPSVKKYIGLSALALLMLGGAGWYAFQQTDTPKHPGPPSDSPQAVTTEQGGHSSESTSHPPIIADISPHDTTPEIPPFSIVLPSPLSDADMLQSLARIYETGRTKGPDISMARAMLQTPAARASADWLLSRSRKPLPFRWYVDFHESYPDWPETAAMRRRAEVALITGQATDDIKNLYFTSRPPETSTGKIYWAKTLLNAGKAKEALDIIRPIWQGEQLLAKTEQQIRNDFSDLLTRQDHRIRLAFLVARKNWDAALRSAKDIGPGFEAIVKARVAVIQNAKKAQALIDAIPKDNRADPLAAHSQLLLFNRQGKYKDAAEIIVKLAETGDKQDSQDLSAAECREWQSQQRFIIRELMDDKAFDEAYKAAAAHISKLGCIHRDADFLAGWIAFRFLGHTEKAKGHFDTLAANAVSASQKARAGYWQGRVAEQQGDKAAAREAYERAARHWNTFYGQLAAENLPAFPLSLPQQVTAPQDIRSSFESMTAIQALRLLGSEGAEDIATGLFIELANSLSDQPHLEALAALAEEQRNSRALLMVSRIAARRGFDLGTRAYPTFGIPDVQGKESSVETPLLYAIAHQESAFNPRAKSHAGALGLMQLMPDTARATATRAGLSFDLERLTSDPAYNAGLGAAHLKDLLSDWDGSLILSFAAYNAGGGNVKKWISAHGDPRSPDIDAIDWIERIPFYETRHYVQRIAENLMIYRRLMGVRQPSLFAREITTSAGPPLPPQREVH